MAHKAISANLQESRQGVFASSLDSAYGRFPHGQHVHAVDKFRGHLIRAGFLCDVLQRHGPSQRGTHPILIILADVNTRQFPELGHVKGLVEGALIYGGLAKETKGHAVSTLILRRESSSGSQGNLSPDDCMSAQKIHAAVEHVHRATFASRTARFLAKQLRHYRFGRHSFGQRMRMLSITRQDIVVCPDGGDSAYCNSLLSNIKM